MTNISVDVLMAKFAEARTKRAGGAKVQALNDAELEARVRAAQRAAKDPIGPLGGAGIGALAGVPIGVLANTMFGKDKSFSGNLRSALIGALLGGGAGAALKYSNDKGTSTAQPATSGYGPPYIIRDGDPEAITGGGVSYPFIERQSAPWLSPSGMFANPLTNMVTGTSGSGLTGLIGGGALGYGVGKGIQNFDLFDPRNREPAGLLARDSSISGMNAGALGDFYGRTLFGDPSGTGSNVRVQPAGGAPETQLTPATPAQRGQKAPQAMSGSAIAEALARQGIAPQLAEGGRLTAEVPGPLGVGTRTAVADLPSHDTPMFREHWPMANSRFAQFLGNRVPGARALGRGVESRVGFPTAAGFREGFLPGGVHTAGGFKGKLPWITGSIGALLPFLPNLYHGVYQPGATLAPQIQTDAGRLDVPAELLGSDRISPR